MLKKTSLRSAIVIASSFLAVACASEPKTKKTSNIDENVQATAQRQGMRKPNNTTSDRPYGMHNDFINSLNDEQKAAMQQSHWEMLDKQHEIRRYYRDKTDATSAAAMQKELDEARQAHIERMRSTLNSEQLAQFETELKNREANTFNRRGSLNRMEQNAKDELNKKYDQPRTGNRTGTATQQPMKQVNYRRDSAEFKPAGTE